MPNTIADNLQRLTAARTAIGNAIVTKGGTVNSGDGLEEFPADIMSIKNDLTSIDITENGTYYSGEETVVTSSTFPVVVNDSNGTPVRHVDINGNAVQNGTPTPDNPIMPQGTGDRTENLFDDVIESGFYNDNGELVPDTTTSHSTTYIPVDGTTYTISGLWTSATNFAVYEWDTNKNWLRRSNRQVPASSTLTFSIGSDTAFFTLQIMTNHGNIMLNTGSTALPYEQYGVKIPILSGGVTTNIYLGSTQTTRKIKKLVLTGDETGWTSVSGKYYALSITSYISDRNDLLSSHFFVGNYSGALEIGQLRGIGAQSPTIVFNYDNGAIGVDGFKSWLAAQYANGTPVCVWYVLATPETAIVNEPLMKIGDYADSLSVDVELPLSQNTKNNIDIDTTVKPSSASFTYNKLSEYIGYNEINVNVPSEASTLIPKTITEDGTYNPSDDSADGYSSVSVEVTPPINTILEAVNTSLETSIGPST